MDYSHRIPPGISDQVSDEDRMSMRRGEFEALVELAAERGAKKALESVGLHDARASEDIRDVRSLLESYREVKSSVLKTVGKAIAVAILGLLAFKSGILWKSGQ